MKKIAAVSAGALLGSLLRYLVAESISRYSLAIFIANLAGVAIAGVIAYRVTGSEVQRLFWIPGFAGGLTTFSSVAVIHAQDQNIKTFSYFFATIIASIITLRLITPRSAR